ncbi:membrane protein [Mesorhizobium sp. L-8-10]|uniref:TRAP transporter small permease n=1 Tax=Mesorhizobium sp. L-8-10 TaxID=2744523 RepID=UPI001925F5F8|nr:TRAP transporter small permease [Mesorhizobium sp. L-8-10]BCH34011.1 membrane protein [Mesorhizobium sp. L-8-10]
MDRAERIFVATNRWALILILAAISVIVFANVALRYLTNYSIVWAEELARYLMIWMTFLGAGLVLRFGGHVGIDSLHHVLPRRWAQILRVGLALLMIAFFAVMAWQGFDYMQRARFQTTPALRISFSYVYAVFPIGFGLLIVHLLLVIRGYVRDRRFAESDEVNADTAAAV